MRDKAWTPEEHIKVMDSVNVSKSVLSITSPGTNLKVGDNKLNRRITRETNEEVAEICAKYPDRFGFFACLPMSDTNAAIEEIDFALDELGALGFVLLTNHHGQYLGDPAFEKIYEKLNERKAIVFLHPTTCNMPGECNGQKPLGKYPGPPLEFMFDTTRTVADMLLSGVLARHKDITVLVPHCGAAIPPLLERFTMWSRNVLGNTTGPTSTEAKELFNTRFYFDLAGFPFPDLIHGFLRVADPSRLLFGTDWPYTPPEAVVNLAEVMDQGLREICDEKTLEQIYSGNAKRILNL